MKANEKEVVARHKPPTLLKFSRKGVLDNDPLFFSSGSSSSDSSFGWLSEAEVVKPKTSCFGPLKRPKHVKTSVSLRSAMKKQNEVQMFDDAQINKNDHIGLIRSKTCALMIYASLKKLKQPISLGGRLTTFLNTLFTNGHTKKQKDSGFEERTQTQMERKSKSTNVSTSSSATSYSRSCLNKNTPKSRDQLNNGFKRTIRFEDHQVSRPCGVKIYLFRNNVK
nr:protein BIG GRAIN 1-like A [Tanacetum cinerariifolium]